MDLNYQIIGSQVRLYRKRRRMTQQALADAIDKSTTYISGLENGQKKARLDTLVSIANTLNVSSDVLLADNLMCHHNESDAKLAELLAGCTVRQREIIYETILALKNALDQYK